MRCAKAKKLISAYIDSELDMPSVEALEEHVAECARCRDLLADLRKIAGMAGSLPEMIPSPKVWTGVRERLAAREDGKAEREPDRSGALRPERLLLFPTRLRFAVSAGLLFLALFGAVLIGNRFWMQARAGAGSGGEQAVLAKLEEAEKHYRKAIQALWEAAQAREGNLDPRLAEIFLANLESIDVSIELCRRAVESDPGDLEPRSFLLAALEKKAQLLNSMLEISDVSSPAKNAKSNL